MATAYYAARDMDERGLAVLRKINGKVEGYNVDAEYAIIRNTILHEFKRDEARTSDRQGWKEVLRSYATCFSRQHARRTLGAALPACAQQLTGLAFLNVYSSLFFRQSGFDNAFLITAITSEWRCSLTLRNHSSSPKADRALGQPFSPS